MRQRIFLYSFILLDPLFLLRDAKSAANPAIEFQCYESTRECYECT